VNPANGCIRGEKQGWVNRPQLGNFHRIGRACFELSEQDSYQIIVELEAIRFVEAPEGENSKYREG
jgi:hypothetical protein